MAFDNERSRSERSNCCLGVRMGERIVSFEVINLLPYCTNRYSLSFAKTELFI